MPPVEKLKFDIEQSEFPRVVAAGQTVTPQDPGEDDNDFVHRVIIKQVIDLVFLTERRDKADDIVPDLDIITNGA